MALMGHTCYRNNIKNEEEVADLFSLLLSFFKTMVSSAFYRLSSL
jgi:hypothetical protein